MSDANPQQEPSMEEILASIRRIISEDDEPGANAAESSAEEESVVEESDQILELTEIAEEPEEEPAAAPEEIAEEPAEEAAEEDLSIDDVLDEVSQEDELVLVEPKDEPVPEVPTPPPAAPLIDSSLLATDTAAAAAGTLSGLVAAVDRAHGGSVLGDGNRTIEDLLKEVMRPMVKDWLDENLPGLTERLVRREIERLARHAEDD